MSKEVDQFLSLYRTYEGLLRQRGIDYRTVEEQQTSQGIGRMTIMRQMRNYLCHAEDPGFIAISPVCVRELEKMVKEEQMRGDIVKNHLVTPAKGSLKEDTILSHAIYRMSLLAMIGVHSLPVYDDKAKRLKGIIMLERAAYELSKRGNVTIREAMCGQYGNSEIIVPPDMLTKDAIAKASYNSSYIFCTKDGTLDSQYLGYLDKSYAVPPVK